MDPTTIALMMQGAGMLKGIAGSSPSSVPDYQQVSSGGAYGGAVELQGGQSTSGAMTVGGKGLNLEQVLMIVAAVLAADWALGRVGG